jgi:hypothetical protein
MASRQVVIAPPRATTLRPVAFVQTYVAKPIVRAPFRVARPVALTLFSKTMQSQQRHSPGYHAPGQLRAAFDALDTDGGESTGGTGVLCVLVRRMR